MVIMDGKKVAQKIKREVLEEVNEIGLKPRLSVILVGNNPASQTYVKNKKKDCEECNIIVDEHILDEDIGQAKLLSLISELNNDKVINGILCQLPLPKGYDYNEEEVLSAINPEKDVDAFNPSNVGKIMIGKYDFLPCTPAGIIQLLDEYHIHTDGKLCVVVGRSNIVGKPMSMLLLHRNATVIMCHSRTKDLPSLLRSADIVVSAVGKTKFITRDMIKDGAVVIDVAMNRDENGKLCGDVDYANVAPKCSFITPVPGGVGPMTRAMLMKNTATALKKQIHHSED